jgi:hypothetical protein
MNFINQFSFERCARDAERQVNQFELTVWRQEPELQARS